MANIKRIENKSGASYQITVSSGKDVVSVSKRLGHAKVSTTTDIYSHIIKQADEIASDCLADVMLRNGKKSAG